MPNNQVANTNKPTNTSHSNHSGSTSQCGFVFFKLCKKDFNGIALYQEGRMITEGTTENI
jgi:hypothetical protein